MEMNTKDLKAEIRNKLQSLRTTVEHLEKDKKISKAIVKTSIADLDGLEKLVDGIKDEKRHD